MVADSQRRDRFHTAQARHLDVQNHDVRTEGLQLVECRLTGRFGSGDFQQRILTDHLLQHQPCHDGVIHDQHANPVVGHGEWSFHRHYPEA